MLSIKAEFYVSPDEIEVAFSGTFIRHSSVDSAADSGVIRVGVTAIFPEKTDDLFSHHRRLSVCQFCSVTPIYFLVKN